MLAHQRMVAYSRARGIFKLNQTNYWSKHMANNGWTPERRARQAELIKSWKPWQQSTGPTSAEGKARSSRNAWQGGMRQQLRTLSKDLNAELAAMRDFNRLARP